MRILLTGARGQFGCCFQDRSGDHQVFALSHRDLDISDAAAVLAAMVRLQPELVVNGAAYTAVDRAESEPETAYAVNRDGAQSLAQTCAALDIPLIHLSTDYIFDGRASAPYQVESVIHPLGVYGQSKWQGEVAVRGQLNKHVIIRTAWVFSEYGNNFVKTMLRLGGERSELSVVDDQIGCPTYAGHIAEAVFTIAERISAGEFSDWGTYHLCGDKAVSWRGFANAIFEQAVQLHLLPEAPMVNPIPSEAYPTLAERPHYSVLDNRKIIAILGSDALFDWRRGLHLVLERLNYQTP